MRVGPRVDDVLVGVGGNDRDGVAVRPEVRDHDLAVGVAHAVAAAVREEATRRVDRHRDAVGVEVDREGVERGVVDPSRGEAGDREVLRGLAAAAVVLGAERIAEDVGGDLVAEDVGHVERETGETGLGETVPCAVGNRDVVEHVDPDRGGLHGHRVHRRFELMADEDLVVGGDDAAVDDEMNAVDLEARRRDREQVFAVREVQSVGGAEIALITGSHDRSRGGNRTNAGVVALLRELAAGGVAITGGSVDRVANDFGARGEAVLRVPAAVAGVVLVDHPLVAMDHVAGDDVAVDRIAVRVDAHAPRTVFRAPCSTPTT